MSLSHSYRFLFRRSLTQINEFNHGILRSYASNQNNITTTTESDKSKSEDSSNWTGRNAWKLGLLGLACSTASGFGLAVALWGWRFKKRPALDLFLQQLSPYFEVVAFTNESAMTGGPVLAQLDPNGQYIHYRLFREATRYRNGKHIKDLSCLNRDLSKVILIDCNKSAASLQPRNSFIVNKWSGDEDDRELIDLAAFLRMLARSNVDDTRLVLDYYSQSDDPLAQFRQLHGQLMEELAQRKENEQKGGDGLGGKASRSLFRSYLGVGK